jgi:hypothetical protein
MGEATSTLALIMIMAETLNAFCSKLEIYTLIILWVGLVTILIFILIYKKTERRTNLLF